VGILSRNNLREVASIIKVVRKIWGTDDGSRKKTIAGGLDLAGIRDRNHARYTFPGKEWEEGTGKSRGVHQSEHLRL